MFWIKTIFLTVCGWQRICWISYFQNWEDSGCLKITPLCPLESEWLTGHLWITDCYIHFVMTFYWMQWDYLCSYNFMILLAYGFSFSFEIWTLLPYLQTVIYILLGHFKQWSTDYLNLWSKPDFFNIRLRLQPPNCWKF